MSSFEPASLSLSSISDMRLDYFKTQHELARNFYDDYEFCPLPLVEEVQEHRERIHRRISPYPSPTHSPVASYSIPNTITISSQTKKTITIIDPRNMTPVALPTTTTNTTNSHRYKSNNYGSGQVLHNDNNYYYYYGAPKYYPANDEPSFIQNNVMMTPASFYSVTVR